MSKAKNDSERAVEGEIDNISSLGGRARAANLTPAKRREIASKAARTRWSRNAGASVESNASDNHVSLPTANYRGFLNLLGTELPCYVLSNGQRVIGRTSLLEMLNGNKSGGDLEAYLSVQAFQPFINIQAVTERMVAFWLPETERMGSSAKGLPADLVIDICAGLVQALDENTNQESTSPRLTAKQISIAAKASMFLAACAKTGLDALVDEATGYQYERADDALQLKLKLYLAEEMRKWEKTFPDDLWLEFARLTNWKGNVHNRPKYWGKLVMELVYEYLDPDVAEWLKNNAPAPKHGQNYHQWLSNQYGLKKLVEHIWMLIGVAKTCHSMTDLRDRMAELNGKTAIQLRLYLPNS